MGMVSGGMRASDVVDRFPRTAEVFDRWFGRTPEGTVDDAARAAGKDPVRLLDELNISAALSDWESGRA
ncbi:MAG: hypothetical protein HY722_09485 [Planctomycetes bacterium]|nr:hypothetical protein [Planctomycetota bacterium]